MPRLSDAGENQQQRNRPLLASSLAADSQEDGESYDLNAIASGRTNRAQVVTSGSRVPKEDSFEGSDMGISQASVAASALNLINNVVGAGLFSMPWCLYKASMVGGLALIIFMCVLNSLSFVILAECCELAQTFNYKEMGKKALGERAGVFIQSCCLFYTAGSCISYIVLTGDFLVGGGTGVLAHWAPGTWIDHRSTCMILVTLVIVLPLTFLKNLEPLKYTSFVSFLGVIYATFLIIGTSTHDPGYLRSHHVLNPKDGDAGNVVVAGYSNGGA